MSRCKLYKDGQQVALSRFLKKLFFSELDETTCYPLLQIIAEADRQGLATLKLNLAKRLLAADYFYCKHYDQVGEKGQCGKACNFYQPKNGRSGACRHTGHIYEPENEYKLRYVVFFNTKKNNEHRDNS